MVLVIVQVDHLDIEEIVLHNSIVDPNVVNSSLVVSVIGTVINAMKSTKIIKRVVQHLLKVGQKLHVDDIIVDLDVEMLEV